MAWTEGTIPYSVELFYDGVWNAIPAEDVKAAPSVEISRGRSDLVSSPEPQRMTLRLESPAGKYSPRNPNSPLYGKIGRNTPIRLTLDGEVRFHGEVHTWPTQWDVETFVWVDIEAYGPRRRMTRGESPLRSPMYRAMMDDSHVAPIAYWPCEDGRHSHSFSSALDGGKPMTVGLIPGFPTRDVHFSAYSGFLSSDAVLELGSTSVVGRTPIHPFTGEMRALALLHLPDAGVTDTEVEALNVRMSGTAAEWIIKIRDTGEMGIRIRDADGGIIYDGGWAFANENFNGSNLLFGLWLQKNINDIDYQIFTFKENVFGGVVVNGTLTDQTMGSPRQVILGAKGDLGGAAVGHVAVFDQETSTVIWSFASSVMDGWIGEQARPRMVRLASEESFDFDWVAGDTERLGYQGLKTTLELMDEAAATDGGILFEDRATGNLKYRPRVDLYNQVPLELTYSDLARPFIPTEDDDQLWNVVEVSRDGGGSAKVARDTGTLSIGEIGRYEQTVTLSLRSDGQAEGQATWRLHLGTVDEARYPVLRIRLHAKSDPAVVSTVTSIDIGDRVAISGLPSFLPPGVADMIVQGYTESTDGIVRDFEFNCTPARPWTVAIAEDTVLGRADTVASELHAGIDSTQTTMDVATTAGPYWTSALADYPFDLKLGGEVVTATDVTGLVEDAFTRTVSPGWGTADSGQTWTTSGGLSSDYSVDGALGVIDLTSDGVRRYALAGVSVVDVDLSATVATSALASGASHYALLVARALDIENHYFAWLAFDTAGQISVAVGKRIAAVGSLSDSATTSLSHVAGQRYALRFAVKGSVLKAKAWLASDPEPKQWAVRATDTDITTAGDLGVSALLGTGSTNTLPLTQTWDDVQVHNIQRFSVVRSVNGIAKPHNTGTLVSLANPAVIAL